MSEKTKLRMGSAKSKCCSGGDVLYCIVALFCSPIAILLHQGMTTTFWWNLLFFLLGVLPGILHAWYCILAWKGVKRILWTLVAFIFPPIVAFCKTGCGKELLINVVLTILGFVPGALHATYIVWTYSAYRKL